MHLSPRFFRRVMAGAGLSPSSSAWSASSQVVILFGVLACHDNETGPAGPEAAPAAEVADAMTATAALTGWRQVSPGSSHTCGLDADSLAWCWGWNEQGQLGTGTTSVSEPHPVRISSGGRWRDIQAGSGHTCAINRAGRAFCWGTNFVGELGDGTNQQREAPVAVTTTLTFTQLSVGTSHSCAVTSAGAAYCWGLNDRGQLGDGTRTAIRRKPVKVLGDLSFRHVRAGSEHTCGITTDDLAYCWGRNNYGQLGTGTDLSRARPTRVAGSLKFRLIRTGQSHTCAFTPAGKAYCWGRNSLGGVGDGTSLNERHSPTAVVNGTNFKSLGLGSLFSCGVRTGGDAWCWGSNTSGQLGNGMSGGFRTTPGAVAGGLVLQRVNVGVNGEHVCGLTMAGAVYCWGSNGRGQLGDGTTENRTVPIPVEGS
jgi:alpha-tubulin suppressor-like RCC1 family protein